MGFFVGGGGRGGWGAGGGGGGGSGGFDEYLFLVGIGDAVS